MADKTMLTAGRGYVSHGGDAGDDFVLTTGVTIDVPGDTGGDVYPTIYYEIPVDKVIAGYKILVSLTIDVVATSEPGAIDVFMEVSPDGTHWSSHYTADITPTSTILIAADLPVHGVGVAGSTYTYVADLLKQNMPYYRIGINSHGLNLNGCGITLSHTSIDTWVAP